MSAVAARPRPLRALRLPPLSQPIVAAVLAASVVAGTALAFAPAADLARTAPTEDGFYSLAVARHLGLGDGLTADGLHRTNGFQPLWSLLCAPLYALAGGDRIAGLRLTQLLGSGLWLAFAALVAALARDLARRHGERGDVAAAVAAIVALGSVSVFRLFHNGLETGLLLVLLAAAVLVVDRGGGWTPRRTAAVGGLLGAVAWARLDAAAFVVAVGVVAVAGALWRRRPPAGLLVACAVGAALLVPWLAYNVALDGHVVPSGGRAQSLANIDAAHNARSGLRALGAWALAPAFRPSMHLDGVVSDMVAVLALVLLGGAVALVVRRSGGWRAGRGTAALWLYAAFLAAYYTFGHGAWWFQDRYLAPALVLALPWLATAAEALVPRRHALPALAVAVAALNLPLFAVLLAAPETPPAWSARASNTGTHPNLNVGQAAWAREHVAPACRIGAMETGTLLYFVDGAVNLDGKVDPDALEARRTGTVPAYARRAGVDVLVDIRSGIRATTAGARAGWRPVARLGRFEAWVRRGREACVTGRR